MTAVVAAGVLSAPAKNEVKLDSDLITPEALEALGNVKNALASPDGKHIVYQVEYARLEENKKQQVLYVMNADGTEARQLTADDKSENDAAWIQGGRRIAFLRDKQLWSMAPDGTDRRQLTDDKTEIEGFIFSPDGQRVILIKSIPYHGTINAKPADLPKTSGLVVTDMNYRHWDHYVETTAHPFLANVAADGKVDEGTDILKGEPYECPMAPFGGTEQLGWSPDSRTVAYTCRKAEGLQYSLSTDSDIYLYNIDTQTTTNICKPADYVAPPLDPTMSAKDQPVNAPENLKNNVGYDTNPQYSPDGSYIAWQSMEHEGYESDRNRLCVYNVKTGEKTYVTEQLDGDVDQFYWNADSKSLTFVSVCQATANIYQTNLKGEVRQITRDCADYAGISPANTGNAILTLRHSMTAPNDIYVVNAKKGTATQLTKENDHILSQLTFGTVEEHWVTTKDGKKMLVWIALPPHFDATKKYPTLLFCEGGPQSAVSQFWSYRWNVQIMAANGYVVVLPNRRGVQGMGQEWKAAVSGHWTREPMQDLLDGIDYAVANLPYVDKDRLGCVGASFGGYSVYYLAGHHDKRFKAFIAHDGEYNMEASYSETEEMWFNNWDLGGAPWHADKSDAIKTTYANSPHRFVDKWDTPILCIHGEKDYRLNLTQSIGAFTAARLRGIPAELLLFPDENHWVLKPQNAILWQRTFFDWLAKWVK